MLNHTGSSKPPSCPPESDQLGHQAHAAQLDCQVFLTVDDDRISVDALERIVKAAGQFEGLGTWRPRQRFMAELEEVDL